MDSFVSEAETGLEFCKLKVVSSCFPAIKECDQPILCKSGATMINDKVRQLWMINA